MGKPWAIKEIGRLGLGYKSFATENGFTLGKLEDGLEIYMLDESHTYRWAIASFNLHKDGNYFQLYEVGDRLTNPDIDWFAFGTLYNLGREMLDSVERFLD